METRRKAQVWLYRSGQVLILRRRLDFGGGMAGIWQPVTGHVEAGESFLQGALREALEETGATPTGPVTLLGAHEFDDRWGTHCIEEIFAMEVSGGLEVVLDPREHIAWEWVSLREAVARVTYPPRAEVVEKLEKEISNG